MKKLLLLVTLCLACTTTPVICDETTTAPECDGDSDCADGDICTRDICKDGNCTLVQVCECPTECDPAAAPGMQKIACDDGNPNSLDRCSAVEACTLGACVHPGVRCDWFDPIETQQALCNDGDDCTSDRCAQDPFNPEIGFCSHLTIVGCGP